MQAIAGALGEDESEPSGAKTFGEYYASWMPMNVPGAERVQEVVGKRLAIEVPDTSEVYLLDDGTAEVPFENDEDMYRMCPDPQRSHRFRLVNHPNAPEYFFYLHRHYPNPWRGGVFSYLVMLEITTDGPVIRAATPEHQWTSKDVALEFQEQESGKPFKLKVIQVADDNRESRKESYGGTGNFVGVRRAEPETVFDVNVLGHVDRVRKRIEDAGVVLEEIATKEPDVQSGNPLFNEVPPFFRDGEPGLSFTYELETPRHVLQAEVHENGMTEEPWADLLPKFAASVVQDQEELQKLREIPSEIQEVRAIIERDDFFCAFKGGLETFKAQVQEWQSTNLPPEMENRPARTAMGDVYHPWTDHFQTRFHLPWAESERLGCVLSNSLQANGNIFDALDFDVDAYTESCAKLVLENRDTAIKEFERRLDIKKRYIQQGLAAMRRGGELGIDGAKEFLDAFESPF